MSDRPDNSIGLPSGKVALSPYNPAWVAVFEVERAALQAALGDLILDIQHVGSTAIPGMAAKPILDIAIAVRDFEVGVACIAPLEGLGYQYRGEFGIVKRHYFVKGDPRTHHIHLYAITNPGWENQLRFRDYMIQHPDVAQEYLDLKLELAEGCPEDREAYRLAKAPFIEQVLKLARDEQRI